jgi:DNA modification methylase
MPEKNKITVDNLPQRIIENSIYVIDQPNPNSYTHNFFKYPCKFIPEIPRWAINTYLTNKNNAIILDPFAGSGTTLLEASLQNISSFGTEIDQVAKLVIKVKTTKLQKEQITNIKTITKKIINKINSNTIKETEILLPDINNLNHWFTDDVLKHLGYIYYSIQKISDKDIKDFMLVAMASIIKKVSNADDISPKPYVSNKIKKTIPSVSKLYEDTINRFIEAINQLQNIDMGKVELGGDATHIPLKDNSIDLAVTSPPYINAFDYVRTMRLENLWLHLTNENDLLQSKKKYIGTESFCSKDEEKDLEILNDSELLNQYYSKIFDIDKKRALVVKKFFEEMKKNLQEVYRVLKKDSKYIIVIGNCCIRKVDIDSWKVLEDLSRVIGFTYINHISYEIQNPYIRIPRKGQGGKIAIDHILIIQK